MEVFQCIIESHREYIKNNFPNIEYLENSYLSSKMIKDADSIMVEFNIGQRIYYCNIKTNRPGKYRSNILEFSRMINDFDTIQKGYIIKFELLNQRKYVGEIRSINGFINASKNSLRSIS